MRGSNRGARCRWTSSCGRPALQGGWLYAIGDCNGLAPPTHMGKYHGRIALRATSVEILGEPVGLDVAHAYQSDGGTLYAVDCTCGCSPGTIRACLVRQSGS